MLCEFLDSFGFEYEFASATDYYTGGRFDEMLLTALDRFDKIQEIMLPTLGPERRETYSCFLPVSPKTGHVLQVPTLERNCRKRHDCVSGARWRKSRNSRDRRQCQDAVEARLWAMRWAALGVDYEMSGKDLIDSVTQSSKICRALGKQPPEALSYELFNDELGQKISKSKGNGLSMEEWLTYAAPESLSYFMYQKPKTAKRLYFDVIPKAVDEYHQQLRAYPGQELKAQLNNPVWHIHGGDVPESTLMVPFAMLLNLASVSGAEDKEALWGFIRRYAPEATAETHPDMDQAAGFAVRYFNDFVKPTRQHRAPTDQEREALGALKAALEAYDGPIEDEALQSVVYSIGRERFDPMRGWFTALYEVLLGASQGPRVWRLSSRYMVCPKLSL